MQRRTHLFPLVLLTAGIAVYFRLNFAGQLGRNGPMTVNGLRLDISSDDVCRMRGRPVKECASGAALTQEFADGVIARYHGGPSYWLDGVSGTTLERSGRRLFGLGSEKNVVASTLWSPSPKAWPDPTWMYDVTFHDRCGPGSNWSLDPAELSIVFAPDSKVSQITMSMPGHPFDSKDSPFNPSNRSQ